ncbi:MAG: AraC family transcriptional regulator [Acutalibacteraceae bacterium]|nr:AraC family transcriptional regulator [Acutalibacteraceae bacterium]
MEKQYLNYILDDTTVIFTDSLRKSKPYIANTQRNHESLFFVTNGSMLYEKDDISTIIPKGQVGYIERGSIDKSSPYNCEKVSYIAINFSFNEANHTPTLPFDALCSKGIINEYENLFNKALNHFLFKTPGYMTICNGIIAQIIGLLYNEHSTSFYDFQKAEKLKTSIEYVKNNYENPDLSVNQLAKISYLSEKHLRRLFLDVHKKTPYNYLQEFRINKAEIMLLNTSKSITDIAIQCGFSDIYSFSHCFKKHKGVSPSQYVKTSRN